MANTRYFCAGIFLLLLSCYSQAVEVTWFRADAAPGHILNGPLRDQGYSDQMEQFFRQHLPQYQHHSQTASYPRAIQQLQQQSGCIVGLFPTAERETQLYFSEVRQLVFNNGLIISAGLTPQLQPWMDKEGAIDLASFLQQHPVQWFGGIAAGRQYGVGIDPLLLNDPKRLVERAGDNVFSSLLQMLNHQRIQYTFGFPQELSYHQQLLQLSGEYRFIPIAGAPEFMPSYVACSRDQVGAELIAQINTLLLEHRASPYFIGFYQRWLDPKSASRFQKASQQYFENQARP